MFKLNFPKTIFFYFPLMLLLTKWYFQLLLSINISKDQSRPWLLGVYDTPSIKMNITRSGVIGPWTSDPLLSRLL